MLQRNPNNRQNKKQNQKIIREILGEIQERGASGNRNRISNQVAIAVLAEAGYQKWSAMAAAKESAN
jgi:hypothetical protein